MRTNKPTAIILEGITGSRAYGLDTENSDTDIKGIYVAPTEKILSLDWNLKHSTIDNVDPDWVYHEVEKFMLLAMGGNPTILEMLFLDGYTVLTKQGKMLVDNRHLFLCNTVRKSYYGYAISQVRKLNAKGGVYGSGRSNRYEKHSRHLYRLLLQGEELLRTGKITVRLTPEQREEAFAAGKLTPNELIDLFAEKSMKLDTIESVLPDKPDKEAINKLLLKIRKGN